MTDLIRKVALGAFVLLIVMSVIGWIFEHDPAQLMVPAGLVAAALGIGEGSNIGKRATWNPEHPGDAEPGVKPAGEVV